MHLRLGLAAIFVVSLAAVALGPTACTQGTTPDCEGGACGPGPGLYPGEAGEDGAVESEDAGAPEAGKADAEGGRD